MSSNKRCTTLRPWYGAWPPKAYRGEGAMKKKWWESQRVTIMMFGVLLIGIIILLVYYICKLEQHGDWQLIHDIGIAFIVAAILGVGIDQILRRQLAEDAFKASIGYLLPNELKGEMEWIYDTHILCVEHNQICELRQVDNDTCIIHVHTLRKFRNISSSNEHLPLGVAVDEWFRKTDASKIIAFGYTKLGVKNDIFETLKSTHSLSVKEQKIPLAPEEEVTLWHEIEEVKHMNDAQDWIFAYPTLNPTVIVKAFEGISIDVGFGYRSAAQELTKGTYRLKGTLLPNQRIEMRWWEKEKGEKWANEP